MSDLLLLYSDVDFFPDILSNCELWLDAHDPFTVIKDGSNKVSQWNDKSHISDNGNFALQLTGTEQPLFISSGINGKGAIEFIGAAPPSMRLDSNISKTNLTAMAVVVVTASTGNGMYFCSSVVNNQVLRVDPAVGGDGTLFSHDGVNTALFGFTSSITGIPLFITTEFEVGVAQRIYSDGVLRDTNSYDGTVEANQLGRVLMSPVDAGGRMGELLVYDRILSSVEIQSIHNYISKKWGITLP